MTQNTTHLKISTSIDDFIQIFGEDYIIEEEYDHTHVMKLTNLVNHEYGDVLNVMIDKIILFGASNMINGVYYNKVIAVSSKSITSFHHELMHLFADTMKHPKHNKQLWLQTNRLKQYLGAEWKTTDLRQCFVSKYAMSSLDEDMADTYRELMTMEMRKETGLPYNPCIMRKFELLAQFFTENSNLTQIINKKLVDVREFTYSNYIHTHTSRSEPTIILSRMVRVNYKLRMSTLALYYRCMSLHSINTVLENGKWYVVNIWGGIHQGNGRSGSVFSDYMDVEIGNKRYQVSGSILAECFHRGHIGDIVTDD
jgi:hypothetical protein